MKNKVLLAVLVLIVVVLGFGVIFTYNRIVRSDKDVDEAKAQIEVVCQRRLDLIPNLVETVKGYANFEKETLTAVTQARSSAQSTLQAVSGKKTPSKEEMAEFSAAQSELSSGIRNLLVVVEQYPELKANENFSALQDQIESSENRISVARQRYNSSVKEYHVGIATFPGIVVASLFGFKERPFYEAKEQAHEAVQVKF